MSGKKKLTQEELVLAFNQFMPRRHVFPPLVPDQEPLDNSQTDTDGDEEEEELKPSEQMNVRLHLNESWTKACWEAYDNTQEIKGPYHYLEDNIIPEVNEALTKLANLKNKPKDPIVWLAMALLSKKSNRAPNNDHVLKAIGPLSEFDFIQSSIIVTRKKQTRYMLRARVLPPGAASARQSTSGGKRKPQQ